VLAPADRNIARYGRLSAATLVVVYERASDREDVEAGTEVPVVGPGPPWMTTTSGPTPIVALVRIGLTLDFSC
jgi:hypothetical protein